MASSVPADQSLAHGAIVQPSHDATMQPGLYTAPIDPDETLVAPEAGAMGGQDNGGKS